MNIVSITPSTATRTIGMMSDGSDREIVTETIWIVLVDDRGRKYSKEFASEPTDAQITASFAAKEFADVTDSRELIAIMEAEIEVQKQRFLQLSGEFSGFMDYYFDNL